ncbi:hypothetical protein EDB86DRAFT_2829809 [Lactarius hatsudake]|nr:hypothetical protein EDB86DRAFT_2829809 [Lactarius hatsudake]
MFVCSLFLLPLWWLRLCLRRAVAGGQAACLCPCAGRWGHLSSSSSVAPMVFERRRQRQHVHTLHSACMALQSGGAGAIEQSLSARSALRGQRGGGVKIGGKEGALAHVPDPNDTAGGGGGRESETRRQAHRGSSSRWTSARHMLFVRRWEMGTEGDKISLRGIINQRARWIGLTSHVLVCGWDWDWDL